ncbi:hypothetical protein [Bacillus pumilus]|nr:hypothetical protein [Bacillus pumilus]MCY7575384.1 hypothetical protein [Bacillus pumilus]
MNRKQGEGCIIGSFMFVVMIILASLGAIIAHLFTSKDKRTSAKRSSHHSSTTSTYTDSYTHHASDASCGGDSGDSGGGCD